MLKIYRHDEQVPYRQMNRNDLRLVYCFALLLLLAPCAAASEEPLSPSRRADQSASQDKKNSAGTNEMKSGEMQGKAAGGTRKPAGPDEQLNSKAKEDAGTNKRKEQDSAKASQNSKDLSSLRRVEFVITGTECPICMDRMSVKMRKVPGVKKAAIFRMAVTNFGTVVYDPKAARWQDIVQSIADENVAFQDVKETTLSREDASQFLGSESKAK